MALYLGDTEVAPVIEAPVPETKYGATVDMVLGTEPVGDLSFDGLTKITQYKFAYKFAKQGTVVADREITIQFPDLQEINLNGMDSMFYSPLGDHTSNSRVTFLFPKLTKVSESYALKNFTATTLVVNPSVGSKIIRLDFPLLSEVSGNNAFEKAFPGSTSRNVTCFLESVSFPSLKTITGRTAFRYCFQSQSALKIVSFPALTTANADVFGSSSGNYIFNGCTALAEIHFRADAQATIEAMTGYAAKWGATSSTIYFDL